MNENELQNEVIESDQRVIKFNAETKKTEAKEAIEVKDDEESLTPFYKSSIFGKLFFNWSRYSMTLANKNPLKIKDFRGISEEDKSHNLYLALNVKTYYKRIIILTILNLCCALLEYLQIYFYDSVIANFECRESEKGKDDEEETECPLFPVYVNAIGYRTSPK